MATLRLILPAACFLLLCGCNNEPPPKTLQPTPTGKAEQIIALPGPAANEKEPPAEPAQRVEMGKNVFLETLGDQRRVIIEAQVCFREGLLEFFLTRNAAGKQHESVLTADVDARHIHLALTAAGAKHGKPAQFANAQGDADFKPPTGAKIKVFVRYEKDGKTATTPAQHWVREIKTKKELQMDWVFAGSMFLKDDRSPEPYYAGNDGSVICVTNFASALLDLPIASTNANEGLLFEANTPKIPELGTKVTVILEPVPEKKTPVKEKGK